MIAAFILPPYNIACWAIAWGFYRFLAKRELTSDETFEVLCAPIYPLFVIGVVVGDFKRWLKRRLA